MRLAFFLGLFTLFGQVLLLRGTLTVLLGNELAAGLALAGWLLWTGLGSAAAGRLTRGPGRRLLPLLQASAGVLLPATLAAIPLLPALAGVPAGELPGPGATAIMALLLPAPLCLATGAAFPLVVRRSGAPARAYLAESLGAAAGGLSFTLLLAGRLPGTTLGLILGVASLAVAAHTLAAGSVHHRSTIPAVAALAVLAAAGASIPWLADRPARPGAGKGAARLETAHGLLTAAWHGGQLDVHENGLFSFSVPDPATTEELAHIPLAARAAGEAREVLLVGGSASGVLAEVLKHPVDRVACIEVDPALPGFVAALLPPGETRALRDPRVSLRGDDPRRFIRETDRRWDAIILALPEPRNALVNRLYTADFFRQARRALGPGGILALALDAPANAYLGGEVIRRDGSIWLALREAFPAVAAVPLDRTLFLASPDPGGIDLAPSSIARRLKPLAAGLRWTLPEAAASRLSAGRRAALEASLDQTPAGLVNRDSRPVVPLLDAAAWWRLSGTGGLPAPGRPAPSLRPALAAGLALLAAALLPSRLLGTPGRRRWAAGWTMAGTGYAVLSLEVLLLYAYQVSRGQLLRELGGLLALVMLGLALGALAAGRIPAANRRAWSAWIAAGMLALALGFPALASPAQGSPGTWMLLGVALLLGFLPGFQYPLLASAWGGPEGAGVLYGLDLAGGCLGAAATGTVIVPLAGPDGAAAMAAVVAGVALAARTLDTGEEGRIRSPGCS